MNVRSRFRPRLAAAWLLLATFPPVLAACGGGSGIGGGGDGSPAPGLTTITSYAKPVAAYRAGEVIEDNVPTVDGATATHFAIDPVLPPGLVFDTQSGVISGVPTSESPKATHTVTVHSAGGTSQTGVDIVVGAPLPAAFESLAEGFAVDTLFEGLPNSPRVAKIALAPDGRIFFTLVATSATTGEVRVYDPTSGEHTLFVGLTVFTGGHQGVLGLALDPDFATNGFVYVLASTPGDMATTVDRMVIYRLTDVAGAGTNLVVVVDNLPTSPRGGINVGGEMVFDNTGTLCVSIGDIGVPANAQAASSVSLAGKILRYDVSTVPAAPAGDNPSAGDPEWCRGLRNTFALAVHPLSGDLFGADNGPASDDEINYLQSGRNFEWQDAVVNNPGIKLRNYPDVIVPTGMDWHDGTGWGDEFAHNLMMTSYDGQHIHRLEMSGSAYTDLDRESVWATLREETVANKPLDIACDRTTGAIYVSTFTGLYRIDRFDD